MKSPVNQLQLHSFIGMLAYYGNYIPNLYLHKPILSCLLKKGCPFKWGVKEETAFKAIKDSLVTEVLEHYSFELPLVLMTDSSEYGIGSSLNHRMPNGDLKPIAFYAKTLTDTEINYQICEKKGLAAVLSIKRFHQYLSGRKFTLMTDNRDLECIFKTSKGMSKVQVKRIARWRLQLLEYDFDVQLTKSASMGPADSLSRLIMTEKENLKDDEIMVARIKNNKQVEAQLNLLSIRYESSIDELIKEIKMCMDTGSWPKRTNSSIRFYRKYRTMIEEVDEVLYINDRILLPNSLRSKALQEAHEGHMGIINMSRKLRIKYIWHGLDTDVKNFVRLCTACQNVSNRRLIPDENWPKTIRPMQRIHVDHFYFEGKPYLLLKDVYSGWIEVTSVKSLHANVTIQWFNLIFRRLGFPQCLVTDQAPVFNSCEMEQYCRDVGIVKMISHAYHAASNGTAERAVQHVKNILIKGKIDNVEDLESYLNNCLIEYHELQKDNGRTPAQDTLNRDLRTNEIYYDVITKTWIPGVIEKLIGSRGARVVIENGTKAKDIHVTHLRQRFINVEKRLLYSDEEDELQKIETPQLIEKCSPAKGFSKEKVFDVMTKKEDDKIADEKLLVELESEISFPSLSNIDDGQENSDYTYSPSEEASEQNISHLNNDDIKNYKKLVDVLKEIYLSKQLTHIQLRLKLNSLKRSDFKNVKEFCEAIEKLYAGASVSLISKYIADKIIQKGAFNCPNETCGISWGMGSNSKLNTYGSIITIVKVKKKIHNLKFFITDDKILVNGMNCDVLLGADQQKRIGEVGINFNERICTSGKEKVSMLDYSGLKVISNIQKTLQFEDDESVNEKKKIKDSLIEEFPMLKDEEALGCCKYACSDPEVIPHDGSPKFRRITDSQVQQNLLNEYTDRLISQGVLVPSSTSYVLSPMTIPKPNSNDYRTVTDLREINKLIKPHRYPSPTYIEITKSLVTSSLFSKIDLSKAFHQIPISKNFGKFLGVKTYKRLYEYTRMP
uniref:RNA-directed DNA polymerase n=1 Tax=Strongyloides venezuelensis TaxID=75913 RepID=A0A0K0FHD6_STRVS